MDRLRRNYDGLDLYSAGLPHYDRNFTRDSIISGILMEDDALLHDQLIFSAKEQGTKADPFTGEEPGKIFHEYPPVIMNGRSTLYNACDTTALFIIGHEHYARLSGSKLARDQRPHIEAAVGYISTHLFDDIFVEDPRLSGADHFALKVTYWKDSEIAQREGGVPEYPVAYFLSHVMNMAALRSASILLDDNSLEGIAERMAGQLHRFYNPLHRKYNIAIDARGTIEGTSSDPLHALFYLRQDDLSPEELAAIVSTAPELETPVGYLTLSQRMRRQVRDQYHASTVWPFEQAIINIGARKFGLPTIEEVSRRVTEHLSMDPEIFIVDEKGIRPSGCDPQLWTIAAKKYFARDREE